MSTGRICRPEDNVRLSLPRVGMIKTGFKDNNGFPKSVDYFIPTGRYAHLFTNSYGEKPNLIQIVFPENDPSKVCIERYEYRDDEGRLFARGDGENFEVWDGKKYEPLTKTAWPNLMQGIAKKYPNKMVKKGEDGWSVVLTLNFVVPMIKGIAGYWQFTTKGEASTIPQIRNVFDNVLQKRGFVAGIIFDLSVDFAKSQKPGQKSRYPVVSLVPNESDENVNKIKQVYQLNQIGDGSENK